MKKLILLSLVFLVACKNETANTVSNPSSKFEEIAENVTIIRDEFGVPHIYGKTDADAVFGLLYAQCEDDFNRVERNYIWAIGRLAEIEGEDALYSDLRAKMFMTEEEAKENYQNAPDWLKKLCDAFADGINYYLETHPEVTPKLLTKFEPWMPMYFSEGSIGGDIERVSTQKIRDFYQDTIQIPSTSIGQVQIPDDFKDEPKGSNGIAISGKLTESGNAMLLINPHTSFFFRGEVHVVSEEGLNAYGAVTWGQFFVYQGFNEKTGWMHTSTYTDVIDEYKEKVIERNQELFYQYGDEQRKVEKMTTTLKYKIDNGYKEKQFPIYRTHHGPITHKEDGQWIATSLMWEPVKALEQSYIRTKQDGLEAFDKMMDIKTNSSNNTVYADTDGNIAYYHGNFIPKRNTSFDFTKPVDGSNPETDWKGLHTVDEAIVVTNPENGWIQNCNSTPFTCAGVYSPKAEDYPNYMSLNRENFRGIHAIRLLEKADSLTLDKLIDLAYDPYLPAFEVLIPGLIKAYKDSDQKANEHLKKPIDVLSNWDYAVNKESVAMTLSHYYGMQYVKEGKRPNKMSAMELITYFGTQSPMEERIIMFSKALQQLEEDFGSWNTPWGEVNRYQRIDGAVKQAFDDAKPSIPVGLASGRWGALAAYGARYDNNTKKIYGTRGNSFVAVVEFGDKIKAKTLLAGGQSGDPTSPHFNDQAQRYADADFKNVLYYKEDVEKNAVSTYHPGKKVEK